MNRLQYVFVSFALLLFLAPIAKAQEAYTAKSCSYADVHAVINGPTHTAVNGDTINIPAGSCTWTTGITAPSGVGIAILGNGTPNSTPGTQTPSSSCASNTVITWAISPLAMLRISPSATSPTTRISCIKFPTSGTNNPSAYPIQVMGTCNSSGCPNLRVDNLTIPTGAMCDVADSSFVGVAGVFGVADHNNVGDTFPDCNGVDLINIAYPSWQGVGSYGDQSWSAADSFGRAQQFYLENNTFNYAFGTDTDTSLGTGGGGRFTCRFNTFNGVSTASACTNHGSETTGRPRGGRQMEAYQNTLNCTNSSQGCNGFGMRSGVGIIWGNTFTGRGGGWFSYYAAVATQRRYRPTSWGLCDGTNPYDVNDGGTIVGTYKIASLGSGLIALIGTPLTAGVFNHSSSSPGSRYYVAFDQTTGALAGIGSNTSSTLALTWQLSKIASAGTFKAGDTIAILGSTLYAAGTMTGSTGSPSLTDGTKSWSTNQWVISGNPYNVVDITTGNSYEIGANTSNTISYFNPPYPNWTWTTGDSYVILRASRCLDQPTASGGALLSGRTPAPIGATTETLDPSYEFMDTAGSGGTPTHGAFSSDSQGILADKNFYLANPSFDGSSGTGFGTLASRPASCTTGVAYWATDQGSWNQSGSGGQGALSICGDGGWPSSPSYTPYTYPHPLIAGGTTTVTVNPPTNLDATVQ